MLTQLRQLPTVLFGLSLTTVLTGQTLPPAAQTKIDFVKHVLPILSQKCHSCHGDEVQQSGLRLNRRQAAMRGGDYGPVITPGNSAGSKLIRRLVSGDGGLIMPPTGKLSDDEIGILRAWIDQGADFRLEVVEEPAPKPLDPNVKAILSTVRTGEAGQVAELLAANPDLVRAQDQTRSTLLHHAAGFGSLETMKLLIDKGADVNASNRRKSTPLFWAIHDEAKVRLLLEHGAQVNVKQAEGRTPLYQAATLGNPASMIRLLLSKGADPNSRTLAGMTPLIAASTRGNVDAMNLLIAAMADVNTTNAAGATALMFAASSRNPRAVELLLARGADPSAKNKRNETALADAASSCVDESVRLLLDKGVDVNAIDDRGYSPLMYAAACDSAPAGIVKMLLAKGADPKVKGEGETAASIAAKRGDTEVSKILSARVSPRTVPASAAGDRPVSEAVRKALVLLEKQSHNFIRIGGCNSCHAQDLPSAAAGLARERGLPAPQSIPQLSPSMMGTSPDRIMDLNAFGPGSVAWELFDYGVNRVPSDAYTDSVVRYIAAMQTADGDWWVPESRRPPMMSGLYQTAALCIYSLEHYSPAVDRARNKQAIARAAEWLKNANPTTTQDRAFHLMGLVWAKGNPDAIKRAVQGLAAAQREDGGWSQLPAMATDAYATGQALYALNAAGMAANNPVYQKGVRYLMRTQAADGSWHVKSRSIWIQPYFESGFPYAHDQWISAAGTAWASMALSLTAEPRRISQNTGE